VTGILKSTSMGKTYKDSKEYKDTLKVIKTKRRKLTYEEKEELRKSREDKHWQRLMDNGFS